MATIGTSDVTITDGILHDATGEARTFYRSGVSGTGVLIGNVHDQEQTLTTEALFENFVTADSDRNDYLDAQGTAVTIVDQFDVVWDNVVIVAVIPIVSQVVHPDTPWCLMAQWRVIPET